MKFHFMYNKERAKQFSGQAALSFTLALGGIIIIVALLLAVYGLTFLSSSYGAQLSARASYATESAVHDALLQLARSGGAVPSSYTTVVGSDGVYVRIERDTPAQYQYTITATATVVTYTRTATAVAALDPVTGEFSLLSLSIP